MGSHRLTGHGREGHRGSVSQMSESDSLVENRRLSGGRRSESPCCY